ncbi:hypothetical protein LLG95_15155 [bacterium]|nr:hypothetical protein [bacterium]
MTPLRNTLVLSILMFLAAACAGPRTKWLVTEHPAPLPPNTKVDVYVGTIDPPYQQIAWIETGAVAQETDQARVDQLEELRTKAREVGANAIQDVKILQKRVKSMTPDERVPFKAWQQGRYNLYFMRGMAIKVGERPGKTMSDVEPLEGWAVTKLPVPPPLPQQ